MGAMDDTDEIHDDIVRLARIAMTGDAHDIQLFLRRMTRRHRARCPRLADDLLALLRQSPSKSSPIRKAGIASLPMDIDSRAQLLRIETQPDVDIEPVFAPNVQDALRLLVREREQTAKLHGRGLDPTRTVIFTGAPGVGKSLAAHWLARELGVPLLTLDLSGVMSSFLGRTGNNLRQVIEYAKDVECVLLLDELDAVAKRRDDATEIGELKRLVTVLLQAIDTWPPQSLLVAATNHGVLLDPAVWRRFELRVEFPLPDVELLRLAIPRFLGNDCEAANDLKSAMALTLHGLSFSDAERLITSARRAAAVHERSIRDELMLVIRGRSLSLAKRQRAQLATALVQQAGVSQREANELTGVSRDTIRKRVRNELS